MINISVNINKHSLLIGTVGAQAQLPTGSIAVDAVVISHIYGDDWDGYDLTAQFWQDPGEIYEVAVDDDIAVIPAEILAKPGIVHLAFYGTKDDTRISTNAVRFEIEQGTYTEADAPAPSQSIFNRAVADAMTRVGEAYKDYELVHNLRRVDYPFPNSGYIKVSNGQLSPSTSSGSKRSDFIRVCEGDTFHIRLWLSNSAYSIACYDASKVLITSDSEIGNYSGNFVVPPGISYIMLSHYSTSNMPECYSLPKYTWDEDVSTLKDEVLQLREGIASSVAAELNTNGYLKYADGAIASDSHGMASDYIEIADYITNIEYNSGGGNSSVASVCFYDANKTYLQVLSTIVRTGNIDLTDSAYAEAKYVRIGYYGYPTPDYNLFKGVLYSRYGLERRMEAAVDIINRQAISDPLNILIYGDSITDSANLTVVHDVTTAYTLRDPSGSYTDAGGENIGYYTWPWLLKEYLPCAELRCYARTGAQHKDGNRTSGNERQDLSYQITLSINDIDNEGGAFSLAHFEPDIIIFALGTNDGNPNDTPTSAYAKIVSTSTGIDTEATLAALDRTKYCEAVLSAYMRVRLQWPYAQIYTVLPLQRMSSEEPLGNQRAYLKEIAQKYAGAIIIDGAYESGIVTINNAKSGLGITLKDGLHPNEKGQNMMARMIIASVRSHYVSFARMNP